MNARFLDENGYRMDEDALKDIADCIVEQHPQEADTYYLRFKNDYAMKVLWSGSGDGRLARDLTDKGRFDHVSKEDWEKAIDDFVAGKNPISAKGAIYYYYCLKNLCPKRLQSCPDFLPNNCVYYCSDNTCYSCGVE